MVKASLSPKVMGAVQAYTKARELQAKRIKEA